MPAFRFVAILSAVLFSGAAMYINLVEHPARMECGTRLAATAFGPSYRRAGGVEVVFGLLGTVGGAGGWLSGAAWGGVVGGVFFFCVHSLSLLGVWSTNPGLPYSQTQ